MNRFFKTQPLLGWVLLTAFLWQILPDRALGPYRSLNPHAIMEFVLLLAGISWVGTWAVRWLGPHYGLLVIGLVGGMASSTATIESLGALAKDSPMLARRAALGAVLSSMATLIQLALLLHLLAPSIAAMLRWPLVCGALCLLIYAVAVWRRVVKSDSEKTPVHQFQPIRWKQLLSLTALVIMVTLASSWLDATWGHQGLWLGALISGLLDAHAIVPSVVALQGQQQIVAQQAVWPVLLSLASNAVTKMGLAWHASPGVYARHVALGVGLSVLGVFVAAMLLI
jgi:uncharacterized membrane protein (DUF4010 family)